MCSTILESSYRSRAGNVFKSTRSQINWKWIHTIYDDDSYFLGNIGGMKGEIICICTKISFWHVVFFRTCTHRCSVMMVFTIIKYYDKMEEVLFNEKLFFCVYTVLPQHSFHTFFMDYAKILQFCDPHDEFAEEIRRIFFMICIMVLGMTHRWFLVIKIL